MRELSAAGEEERGKGNVLFELFLVKKIHKYIIPAEKKREKIWKTIIFCKRRHVRLDKYLFANITDTKV